MKHCIKCGHTKPMAEFYKNRTARDGLQAYCKVCWKADCDARRLRNPDRRREVCLASYHRHKHDPGHTNCCNVVKPYNEKTKARRKLQCEVRQGRIVRPPCAICGKPGAQAHHDDYSKPLNVRWLCSLCHAAEHRRIEGRP